MWRSGSMEPVGRIGLSSSSSSFRSGVLHRHLLRFPGGPIREMRAAPRFRMELLSRKAFAGLRVHRGVLENAKKTGGRKAAVNGTRWRGRPRSAGKKGCGFDRSLDGARPPAPRPRRGRGLDSPAWRNGRSSSEYRARPARRCRAGSWSSPPGRRSSPGCTWSSRSRASSWRGARSATQSGHRRTG